MALANLVAALIPRTVRMSGEMALSETRISDYALIGDCMTAALVGRGGSIDWLCWPRFDSGACFAALLGTPDHGRWLMAPVEASQSVRRFYRGDSLVLETVFRVGEGEVAVIDFMASNAGSSTVIRLVEGRAGTVAMRMELVLRFDYGAAVPWVSRLEDGHDLVAIAGPDMVVLRCPVASQGEDMRTVSEFEVTAGQRLAFTLSHGPSHLPPPPPPDALAMLAATEREWADWNRINSYSGPHRALVQRSLITLKALTYAPTGGIVAAPTTSLPEQLGGVRNWDYRYCWLRDATLTLLAFMRCSYFEEAAAWRDWLHRSVAGSPDQIQIMYGIAGERRLPEWELPGLPGFQNSAPVRVGNDAAGQLQLDVYGEVMNAMHQARAGGLAGAPASWSLEVSLVEHLEQIWQEPDEGIWETRGGRKLFTFSRAMAWVAVDRAIQSAETFALPAPLERWRTLRETMHATICERGFNTEARSFVSVFDGDEYDASLLLLPTMGFLPASDPRIQGTVAAVERHLLVDGFVRRYDTKASGGDGLPPGEGVFLACSFWLAQAYALMGRRAEALALFERLVGLANDVGLMSEEYDSDTGQLVGNFPQAFSHVALIATALALDDNAPVEAARPA